MIVAGRGILLTSIELIVTEKMCSKYLSKLLLIIGKLEVIRFMKFLSSLSIHLRNTVIASIKDITKGERTFSETEVGRSGGEGKQVLESIYRLTLYETVSEEISEFGLGNLSDLEVLDGLAAESPELKFLYEKPGLSLNHCMVRREESTKESSDGGEGVTDGGGTGLEGGDSDSELEMLKVIYSCLTLLRISLYSRFRRLYLILSMFNERNKDR